MTIKRVDEVADNYFDKYFDLLSKTFEKSISELRLDISEVKAQQNKIESKVNDLTLTVVTLSGKNHADDCPYSQIIPELNQKQAEDETIKKNWKIYAIALTVFVAAGLIATVAAIKGLK